MRKLILSAVFILFLSIQAHADTIAEVNGMVCDFCAQALEKVFLKEDGVKGITVSLDDQTVTIHYKDGAHPLHEEEIERLIEWGGYDFVGVRDSEAP